MPKWTAPVGGRLTQPVTADGKVYVVSIDRHTVYALHAGTGKPAWQFTAGGRVDSPPSLYRGLAVFGCRDGWIYCLRCRDGELVWRRRAAAKQRLVMSYGQLESAWPVHGSVLIEGGEVHCAGGADGLVGNDLERLTLPHAIRNGADK